MQAAYDEAQRSGPQANAYKSADTSGGLEIRCSWIYTKIDEKSQHIFSSFQSITKAMIFKVDRDGEELTRCLNQFGNSF